MKFEINSSEFKNITERAAVVAAKKGIGYPNSLQITADKENNRVIIKTFNLDSFVEIYSTNAEVYEGGKIFVDIDNIKYLYNVPGYITVETMENSIRIKGERKQSEVKAEQGDEEYLIPGVSSDKCFAVDKEELLSTIKEMSCFVSGNDVNKLLATYHIDNKKGEKRVVVLDGHRILKKIVEWDFNQDIDINIPEYAMTKELPKVAANKYKTEKIKISYENKYIKFVGNDYTYITSLTEGKYYDIDSMLNASNYSRYGFDVNANDLYNISKEYYDTSKGNKNLMIFYNGDGVIITGIMTKKYMTSDILEIKNGYDIPDKILNLFNPMYIMEFAKLFKDNTIHVESIAGYKNPAWLFYGGVFTGLVLPMSKLDKCDLDKIEKFIQGVR